MKKRFICLAVAALLLFTGVPAYGAMTGFTDVPAGSWAEGSIAKAVELGVIGGYSPEVFGYGDEVTRAQFTAMVVRLFRWDKVMPAAPAFSDNADPTQWYYTEIETAAAHGAVQRDTAAFRPEDPITREEMAVMLVRALGYNDLAQNAAPRPIPFTDVKDNRNAVMLAYDFGLISGMTETLFEPAGRATREQAAAMMIRLHTRYTARLQWLHGFYALSSYDQKDIIPRLDAVSFGWSQLEYAADTGVKLNTTSSGNNGYAVPSGAGEVVALAKSSGVPANLNVIMTTSQQVVLPDGTLSNPCREILLDASRRKEAIRQIMAELSGEHGYAGVTVDFEGMKGPQLKQGLNLFVEELRGETTRAGKLLYVCVPPVTRDGVYFDAYDYPLLGRLADKVILMAHDFQATSLSPDMMAAGFTTTPLTPLPEIYYALAAITDKRTGVADTGKIALAFSMGSVEWAKKEGAVINPRAFRPAPASIYSRLTDPATTLNYSERYQNPFATFRHEGEGADYVLWYEDERSIGAKIRLARMFGINSLSVWRLGLIPNYPDSGGREIHYNVLELLQSQR